jgi:glutathione S-transferase
VSDPHLRERSEALTLFVDAKLESPYAFSAFVALEEKRLPYTLKALSLQAGEHRKPDYRATTGRIPSLQHGDYVLAESSAIAEYLADVFPFPDHPRLFPVDFKERNLCRMVQAWVRSDFMPIREERSSQTVFYKKPVKQPLSARANDHMQRLLKGIDGLIRDGRTTLFDAWCIADTDLAMMLQRLVTSGDPVPPKLKAYAESNWERPSVQKWLALERQA